jgi:uncharacterized damage-inducible protein DinB
MDAKTYLQKQIESMWHLQDAALTDLKDEQLGWVPPGTVSPIGVIWLHMLHGEDLFITTLMGGQLLWESDGWKERFGLEKVPEFGADWSVFQDQKLTVEMLRAYMAAVRKQTQACLDITSEETLDETVKFFSDHDPKADIWILLSHHILMHSGEIAALKGAQGVQGLPF